MFGLGKSSSSSGPTYFDIRIKSTYRNLIIVRGSLYDSPSVIISGHLVFSIPEEMTVKKISLSLSGKYKLDFLEVLAHPKTTVSNPVKQETTIFESSWDNLLISGEGRIIIGNSHDEYSQPNQQNISNRDLSISSSSLSLSNSNATNNNASQHRRLMRPNTPSAIHLSSKGVSGTPFENLTAVAGASFVLPAGNYELPFKCVLPGDIPETVEGLLAGSILYKFQANIERGGFKSPISKFKYFRIFRTLSSDNLSLSETMSIGKSWPDKVQYEVSIPSKAVPIGGTTPVNILLVPLIKGLKLGSIKAQLIQYYAFKGETGDLYDDEQIVLDCTMSDMINKDLSDKLNIESFIKLPSNLKKVTQDCDFKDDLIKVRHKLKIQINLINIGGHISELRANLPISLFISPNVDMSGRKILLDKHGKIHFRKEEDKLFKNQSRNVPVISETSATNPCFAITAKHSAPPNYDEHVFDRIIDTTGIGSSANNFGVPNSQAGTPRPLMRHAEEGTNDSYFELPTSSTPVSPLLNPTERGEILSYNNISEVPSYQDTMNGDDDPNPSEDFAPLYHNSDEQSSHFEFVSGSTSPPNTLEEIHRPESLQARPGASRSSSMNNILASSSSTNLTKLMNKKLLRKER